MVLNVLERISLKVIKLDIPVSSSKRFFVISDLHGNYDLLAQLIKDYQIDLKSDYLFILGDLTLKGPYPLQTLRYVMELAKHYNVYPLMGNCDETELLILEPENHLNFKEYLECQGKRYHSAVLEMYLELLAKKVILADNHNYLEIQRIIKDYYFEEINFLENLPHLIETPEYYFVHARLPQVIDYQKNTYKDFIGGRDFFKDGHQLNKVVVCGHMPTTIFRNTYSCDNILIDNKKKIILIDGGMIVREGGQLNLCCLDENGFRQIATIERLPLKKVIHSQYPTMMARGACWPYYQVKVLQKGPHFTMCLMRETLEIANIKNEYLENQESIEVTTVINDCPSSLLEVNVGDLVKVINESCTGYTLIKKDGKVGWIKNEYLGGICNEN